MGRLFGLSPRPMERCRVLEIGCGDGGNLIPMACTLPGSRFTGLDLATSAIEAAQRAAGDLGLANLELRACNLLEIDAAWGEFDYILAHGLYSWVPADVRGKLLAVCRDRLAPDGIAFVSYNAYPGGYARQVLREMMLDGIRGIADPREQIARARECLDRLRRQRAPGSWSAVLRREAKLLLGRPEGALYHDELAACNDRFYFRDFEAAAARHGLQYLGEAEPHEMFDPAGALAEFAGGTVDREQHLDFLKGRRFRQTLLCRAGKPLRRDPAPERMAEFLFSAPGRLTARGIEGARGVRMRAAGQAAQAVALALGELYPLPLPFGDLVPYAGSAETLAPILFAMVTTGFADLHVYDFPCEESVPEHPCAFRLARYQAAGSREVTSVCHIAVQLNASGRRLLALLDGTRTHEQLAQAAGLDRRSLQSRLEWLAARGLLEG